MTCYAWEERASQNPGRGLACSGAVHGKRPTEIVGRDVLVVGARLFWRPSRRALDGIALEANQLGLVGCPNGARLHGQPMDLAFCIAAGSVMGIALLGHLGGLRIGPKNGPLKQTKWA